MTRATQLIVAMAAILLAACSPRAPESAATAASTAVPIAVPFEKFELANGLQVVLHVDDSDPALAIDLAAHVGSARELPGRTGFAHLFEHLLFLDSENLGYGGLDELNTRIGGTTVNGFTTNDMTQYYQTAPADALEKIIWAEAEKLGFFIKTVTEEALANERQVVKNEKRQSVDNRPYGHLRTIVAETLYPPDHPYSWTVIGSLEDLDAASLEDVRTFYRRWYRPNNVTLTIAGDFDPAEARRHVETYFGELPAGEPVEAMAPRAAELEESVSLYHEDTFARVPQLTLVWPTVEQYHPDAYALEVLVRYLSEGKEAPLVQVLVEEEALTSALYLRNDSRELAGELSLTVPATAGGDLDALLPAIEAAFGRFAEGGIGDDDLARIKAGLEVEFYSGLEDVVGKAVALGQYNLFTGDPGFLSVDVGRALAVTAEDVRRVYETYVAGRPRLAVSMVPRGQVELALAGASVAAITEERIVAGEGAAVDYDPTARTFDPTPSEVDRSEPPFGRAYELASPAIWEGRLDNGIRVVGIESGEIPVVSFVLRIDAGRDRGRAEKAAVPALTAELLMRGTAKRSVAALENALQMLGAEVSFEAGRFATEIEVRTLARNLGATVALIEEMLTEPRWDEEEFALLVRRIEQQLALRAANPNAIADRLAAALAYPDDHVFHYPEYGTEAQLATITLDDLKAFHAENYRPGGGSIRIVGAVSEPSALQAFAGLAAHWRGGAPERPPLAQARAVDRARVHFHDVPGSKQSVLRVQRPSVAGTDPDFPLLESLNYFLGGSFTSDLNSELRVAKGYTYGIRSRFEGAPDRGRFSVATSVRSNVTLESLVLIRDIVDRYGPTFDEARLAALKAALQRRQALVSQTQAAKLGLLERIVAWDHPLDYRTRDAARLDALTLEEFSELAARHLRPEAMDYIVVGDAETQAEGLTRLGFGPPRMLRPID
ncbi:MAG: pitrilysin family protein [Pseudomonadales bacterium]|jgi:zinc protease|nr:pitrilysin family protein [Pseudomonadales bacterium]